MIQTNKKPATITIPADDRRTRTELWGELRRKTVEANDLFARNRELVRRNEMLIAKDEQWSNASRTWVKLTTDANDLTNNIFRERDRARNAYRDVCVDLVELTKLYAAKGTELDAAHRRIAELENESLSESGHGARVDSHDYALPSQATEAAFGVLARDTEAA